MPPKKVLIALPPAMLGEVDYIAEAEHRTRSDMIREALRRYIEIYRTKFNRPQTVAALPPSPVASLPAPAPLPIVEPLPRQQEEATVVEKKPVVEATPAATIGFRRPVEVTYGRIEAPPMTPQRQRPIIGAVPAPSFDWFDKPLG